jgi:hypothetical protein
MASYKYIKRGVQLVTYWEVLYLRSKCTKLELPSSYLQILTLSAYNKYMDMHKQRGGDWINYAFKILLNI